MASSKFKSWDNAHDKFPSGERFKEEFGIDNHSVKKALSRNSETKIHSELKRLLERINGFLGTN
jgi:hypothetical protein